MNETPMRTAVVVMAASAAAFVSASAGMSFRQEPFLTYYFLFAWWPYIFGAESLLVVMGGYSTLYERPRSFWALLPLSVIVWLAFEAANFRLGNWYYIGLPRETAIRWGGYVLAYATVLPALSVTRRLLEFLGLWEDVKWPPLRVAPWRWPMFALGVACLVLPLAWPKYCFPLIWGAPVFLLEPVLYGFRARSHLRLLLLGKPRRLLLVLVAGFLCGGMWECWNYWAGAKWYYAIPFVDVLHIFEMPVLGFLGFPPFALACDVIVSAFRGADRALAERSPALRWSVWGVCAVLGVVCAVMVMQGIDEHTVVLLRS